MSNPNKPLGGKGYGSIPHLPGSRMGPADHACHDGQDRICCLKVRDKYDRIIVTEKLDGSNVSIANVDGQILAITRAGYLASTSPYEQHHIFADWVKLHEGRFRESLSWGTRFVGEWLAQAHATRYVVDNNPLVVFDFIEGKRRHPWDVLIDRATLIDLPTASVISDGHAYSIDAALAEIQTSRHGAIDPVEGAVWRVERKGEFDFMAKFVRHDKKDGIFLPEISGQPAVWNWRL